MASSIWAAILTAAAAAGAAGAAAAAGVDACQVVQLVQDVVQLLRPRPDGSRGPGWWRCEPMLAG